MLDNIFTKAFLKQNEQAWARDWIAFAKQLVPSAFSSINTDVTSDDISSDDEFQEELMKLSDAWIQLYKFDGKLFDSIMGDK